MSRVCLCDVSGVCSIGSMLVIGYDRYNVIVKGFNGVKMTYGKALGIILCIWIYSVAVCMPPFLGWGKYALGTFFQCPQSVDSIINKYQSFPKIWWIFHDLAEGQLISCSYDYLSQDWNSISFVLYAYICNYCIPVLSCIYFYSQIVMAVVKHERALKEQAKKMNVESLRSGDHVSYSNFLAWNSSRTIGKPTFNRLKKIYVGG